MKRDTFAWLALLGATCAGGRTPAAAEEAGLDVLRQDCLTCHTEDLVSQQRLTPAQWAKTVDKMHGWGAPTEGEDLATLTGYLAGAYGREAPAYQAQVLPADAAAALFEPLPDPPFAGGKRKRGGKLYAELCLPCHGADGHGGPLAVRVADRHVLDRAAEFAAAVREGRGAMPGFTDTTDAQVADLLAYVRSLSGH